jgi:hypothetical protein
MANPTSNFGWQMPTNTDLVKDLPADFEVFGQAVDTSLMDLKGGTTGQVLSKASNTDMDFTWVTSDDANAIQNTIVDAKGDLISATGNDVPARLAVGNNGDTLLADSFTSTGLRWQGNYAAGKNKIINGDFAINQRAFVSTTSNAIYMFDRFVTRTNDALCTYSAQTFTPGTAPVTGYEAANYIRLVTSGQTATNTLTILRQQIEDVRTFANQNVTLSVWAKANSGTPKVGVSINQNFASASSNVETFGTAATISTSWTRYSWTITLPSISGKTIGAASSLIVNFFVSAGSDFSASIGTGIQSNTFEFWGVQLEAGSVATAFQTATGTLQGELAACQRYLPKTTFQDTMGYAYATDRGIYTVQYSVTPRVAPTGITASGTFLAYALNSSSSVTPTFNVASVSSGSVIVTSGLTITAGQGSRMNGGDILWTGCEL